MREAPTTRMWRSLLALVLAAVAVGAAAPAVEPAGAASTVEALFGDWRHFETPPLHEGAADYRAATLERRRAELPRPRARLASLAASNASTDAGIDLALIRAENESRCRSSAGSSPEKAKRSEDRREGVNPDLTEPSNRRSSPASTYSCSPPHDHRGMRRPSGTSAASSGYAAMEVVVAHSK